MIGRKIFRLKELVFAGPWFMMVRERNVLGCLEVEVQLVLRHAIHILVTPREQVSCDATRLADEA